MKFLKLCLLLIPLCWGACSCVSDSDDEILSYRPEDALTPQETEVVIAHVRRFLLRASKVNLSPAEREVIRTVRPGVNVRYTGPKTGRMSIRWDLPNYRTLLLQRSGNLLSSERADWIVRVISGRSRDRLPSHFFGANGEDVSLPER